MPAAINELKALGLVLPPSERVEAGATADVLSAVIAVLKHGAPILEVAGKGIQEVYDFYHDHAVKVAERDGTDAPLKGAPQSAPVTQTTPPGATVSADVQRIENQVAQLTDVVSKLATVVTSQQSEAPAQPQEPVQEPTQPAQQPATESSNPFNPAPEHPAQESETAPAPDSSPQIESA